MNVKHYFLLFLLFFSLKISQAQESGPAYSIEIKINGIADTTLILAHRYGDKFFTDQTISLNSEGKGVFEGDEVLMHGMYQIVLPNKSFFDFFIEENQKFKINSTAGDFLNSNHAIGNPLNELFFDWYRASAIHKNSPEMIIIWDTTIQSAGNSLLGKFLNSLQPFSIPEEILKQDGFRTDQLAQYHYYKNHFFDNTDLADPRLIRTPAIHNKLNQFFTKVAPPQPDSLIYYSDLVLEKTSSSSEVFRYTLQFLINHYSDPKIMGTDAVYVHLAEKYYLSGIADWIDEANLKQISNRVRELKPLLLGRKAPKLVGLQTPEGLPTDPFQSNSKWKILYFWEPDCGHCKKATPDLFREYDYFKSIDAEVFAINTRLDMDAWTKFIAEHELAWVNLYSPLNVREVLENFQAWSTPIIYILNGNNEIVAKDLSVAQVKEYMQYLVKD